MHDNADYVTLPVSEKIGRKAARLVDDRRVRVHGFVNQMLVIGDTDDHVVLAQEDRVWCDCPAWRPDRPCSHQVASMIVWGERAD